MLQVISHEFDLPDVDFLMIHTDHLSQASGARRYNGTFNPALAPISVPCCLQQDSGSVAVPGWAFYKHTSIDDFDAKTKKKSAKPASLPKLNPEL